MTGDPQYPPTPPQMNASITKVTPALILVVYTLPLTKAPFDCYSLFLFSVQVIMAEESCSSDYRF